MMRGGLSASRAKDQVGRVPTILVVDDEPAIRTMVRHMLARLPCIVVEAGDGDDALAYIRREPPDLILLDIVMPRLDGWAVLRTLQEEGITPDLAVVLISGNVVLDEETARELGAAAVLPKPFQLAAVRALVQELLAVPAP
jgi:CheY-like chemotaxis protein